MPIKSHDLKSRAADEGFELVGICAADPPESLAAYLGWVESGRHGTMDYLACSVELRSDPGSLLPNARSILAVGLNYNQSRNAGSGSPKIAKYALGRDYHRVIRSKLRKVQRWIASEAPEVRVRICVDSAPLLEREYAHRAGLGWFGKNTMLIDSRRGSWFLLGFMLLDAALDTDTPATGGCGTCRLCVDACPTGCIEFVDGRWQIDARRCISYLTIEHHGPIEEGLADQMGDWTFGCDVCQEVCPFNQPRESQPLRATNTNEPEFLARREWPSLQRLAVIQPDEWDTMTAGSPVRRAGLEGLRRNAAINLANASRLAPDSSE